MCETRTFVQERNICAKPNICALKPHKKKQRRLPFFVLPKKTKKKCRKALFFIVFVLVVLQILSIKNLLEVLKKFRSLLRKLLLCVGGFRGLCRSLFFRNLKLNRVRGFLFFGANA